MTTEADIQANYIKWVNGTHPNDAHAFKIAAVGRVGYPDTLTIIRVKREGTVPLFIEFKSATGVVSPIQRHIIDKLRGYGAYVSVCASLHEAKEVFYGVYR